MYEPLRTLGIAMAVNWFCDMIVLIVNASGVEAASVINIVGNLDTVVYIMVVGVFLFKLQDYYLQDFLEMVSGEEKLSAGTVSLAHRASEVAIIAGTIISSCSYMGVSQTVLAGLYSLLGIGFGFASQEVLQNFFGGLMLVVMQPFQVGDRIIISNPVEGAAEIIEGQVIDIGYYQTTVFDEEEHPIYVPNQWFVSVDIKNLSRDASHFKTKKFVSDQIKENRKEAKGVGSPSSA
jgi:small-conductance mechanosensitive channel